MKRLICAGNWKMHKTAREAVDFFARFAPHVANIPQDVAIVLCAPFTSIPALSRTLTGETRVFLGAQDVHWDRSGAFTGAIAAPMLREFGVRYVIVGHSERRRYFADTDETVRMKTAAALEEGLTPIVAVGETLAIREAEQTEQHVLAQTRAALDGLDQNAVARVVLAYEPVWAIGTGRNCDPREAGAVMAKIRAAVRGLENVPILYGGSVTAKNIGEYTAQEHIDGGLVGGASLDPDEFANLCRAACR